MRQDQVPSLAFGEQNLYFHFSVVFWHSKQLQLSSQWTDHHSESMIVTAGVESSRFLQEQFDEASQAHQLDAHADRVSG
jgi:hypothetical protein